jgi:hypothetical protein
VYGVFTFHITKNAKIIFYITSFQQVSFRWEDIVTRLPQKCFDRIWHLQIPNCFPSLTASKAFEPFPTPQIFLFFLFSSPMELTSLGIKRRIQDQKNIE